MKFVENILDAVRPHFKDKGTFAPFYPAFAAIDYFLLAPPHKTHHAPYGREAIDCKRYMSLVIAAMLPCLAASFYFYGLRMLAMIVVSYAVGLSVELVFAMVRKEEIAEGFFVTGLIFPLCLPPGTPLWMVGLGVAFGVIVGKEVFGGSGRNLFNPAIVGRVFLAISYPAIMSKAWILPGTGCPGNLLTVADVVPDGVTCATPLVMAKSGELTQTMALFLGNTTGSAGETSALAILAGGIFLVLLGIASYRTVIASLGSFVILNFALHQFDPANVNPVLFNLLSGGFLFGTFFMATDPITSPVTQQGKWIYGIIIGTITLLIRSYSGYVEGMMFAVLLGNICAPAIDEIFIRMRIRRFANE